MVEDASAITKSMTGLTRLSPLDYSLAELRVLGDTAGYLDVVRVDAARWSYRLIWARSGALRRGRGHEVGEPLRVVAGEIEHPDPPGWESRLEHDELHLVDARPIVRAVAAERQRLLGQADVVTLGLEARVRACPAGDRWPRLDADVEETTAS
jgi:hypothetical protein